MGCLGDFAPISSSKEFANIYKSGKKWHCPCAVVYFLADDEKKFTAVVSKKIGNAVKRNRVKRVIRAVFFDIKIDLIDANYVIIAKKEILEMSHLDIKKNLKWAFKKLGSTK